MNQHSRIFKQFEEIFFMLDLKKKKKNRRFSTLTIIFRVKYRGFGGINKLNSR